MTMNKQTKTLIALGVVLVLLIAAWATSGLWLGSVGEETTTTTKPAVDPVFETDIETVGRIEIRNETDEFVLLPEHVTSEDKTEMIWSVQGMEDYPYSSKLLEELANVASLVYASEEITVNETDLDQFGLATPTATFTVVLESGQTHVIKIGKKLPSGNYDYVMLDNTGRICSLAGRTADRIKQSRLDLLDKKKVIDVEVADLTRFTFERARDDLRIVAECELIGEVGSGNEYLDFSVVEPIVRDGSPENLNKLVQETLLINVDRFVEIDPEDMGQYGLEQPQYAFALDAGSRSVHLSIGDAADGSSFYAYSDIVPAVFTVKRESFTTIDMRPIEMLDRFVSLTSIWDVSKIEGDLFGETFVAEINMDKDQRATDDEVEFKLDGRDAKIFSEKNRSLFSNFYQRIIGILIAGLDTDAEPVNTSDASITYHLKANPESGQPAHSQLIEFAKRNADDYTYYVFIDGEYTGFYVDGNAAFTSTRADSEGLIVALKMMRYAMDNAVDGVFDTQEGYQLD